MKASASFFAGDKVKTIQNCIHATKVCTSDQFTAAPVPKPQRGVNNSELASVYGIESILVAVIDGSINSFHTDQKRRIPIQNDVCFGCIIAAIFTLNLLINDHQIHIRSRNRV